MQLWLLSLFKTTITNTFQAAKSSQEWVSQPSDYHSPKRSA